MKEALGVSLKMGLTHFLCDQLKSRLIAFRAHDLPEQLKGLEE